MRRDFGSQIPDIVDRKMTPQSILSIYVAAAAAILRWEPRFRMLYGKILDASATGRIDLEVRGVYYPRGHLGDYSVAEDASVRTVVDAAL